MSGPGTNPYTSQSTSGYNASPPADDGSQSEANRITWAKIKTKLADILKTFGEAIDSAVLSAFGKTINTDANVANSMAGSLGFEQASYTIASGSITPYRTNILVDTESSAATDDLDNIVVTNMATDAIIVLRAANTARDVVVRHNAGGSGNIFLISNANYTIDDDEKTIILQRRSSSWYEIARAIDLTKDGQYVQHAYAETVATDSTTSNIPFDDTIPQNSEGDEAITVAITPKATTNILIIEGYIQGSQRSAGVFSCALFQDTTADALSVANCSPRSTGEMVTVPIHHRMAAGTVSATTFKIRYGNSTGDSDLNQTSTGRKFGGVCRSFIKVTEVKP